MPTIYNWGSDATTGAWTNINANSGTTVNWSGNYSLNVGDLWASWFNKKTKSLAQLEEEADWKL